MGPQKKVAVFDPNGNDKQERHMKTNAMGALSVSRENFLGGGGLLDLMFCSCSQFWPKFLKCTLREKMVRFCPKGPPSGPLTEECFAPFQVEHPTNQTTAEQPGIVCVALQKSKLSVQKF